MAMQESGKGSAAGAASLSVDEADELAANFRPAWAAEDADDLPPNSSTLADFKPPAVEEAPPPAPAAAAPAPAPAPTGKAALAGTLVMSQSPVEPIASTQPAKQIPAAAMTMPLPDAPRKAPSSPALKSTAVMNNMPPVATLPSATAKPVIPSAPPPANNKPAIAKDPFASPARAPHNVIGTEELNALVPQRSNKTFLFVAIGLGVVVGLGLFVKFAVMSDDPKPATPTSAQTTTPPATPTAEIPPPPAKEDIPPPTAKADPPPNGTVTAPPKVDPPPPPPQAVAAAPVHHAAPVQPQSRPVSRPHSEPQSKPNPPSQPAQPTPASKTPPKGQGGGIVRDSPF